MVARRRGLFLLALLLAALGSLAAMAVLMTSAPRPDQPSHASTGADFGIAPYTSAHDQDGDGVDDQTDILAAARTYCATRPIYGSTYYEGGYPDDGRGVCTDLVAAALRGAGYDLRTLVDADIRAVPDAYDVEVPDANIDYRRVRNLRVWFERHALALSCDPNAIDQWQGGDIVCYENHIGVVSDRRNGQGVPYVIHHWGKGQRHFEEDRLASYGPIVGHWRMS